MTALSVLSAIVSGHVVLDRRGDDVLGADDVRLDGLERVVLAGRHLLQRGGVDDDVDAAHRAREARQVADVADEVAQPVVVVGEAPAELRLLQLVAAEDADRLRVVAARAAPR